MLHRFEAFIKETFMPKNVDGRDIKMDDIVKQKESGGEVYIDFRDRNVTLIKPDNGKLPLIGSIYKRNPWSSGIQFKKVDKILCEFVFYLHPVYADAKKKNLYEPYKFDHLEMLGSYRDCLIVYDENVDKLVENMCKLIYNSEEITGVQKALSLKKIIIDSAFKGDIFINKQNVPK